MSNRNKFQLNGKKCKEIRVSFARCQPQFEPVYINDIEIEVLKTVKLLGLNISSDLKWNCHVSEIVKKAATRLYFLKQLKRAKIAEKELIIFYITCIRPITEYACAVFHKGLSKYLSIDLGRIQKRALRIIYPFASYADALEMCDLPSLYDRRDTLTTKLFEEICCDPNHKLHHFLPEVNRSSVNLRNRRKFNLPICKTTRLRNSFIFSNSEKKTTFYMNNFWCIYISCILVYELLVF